MTWHSDPVVVTARKAHRCDACQRKIEPGERYERGFGVDRADHWMWKWCLHCHTLVHARWYDIEDDGDGITYDSFEGWADSTRYRRWGVISGTGIDWTEVRHAAGWRMRWRTQAGTLLPVPSRNAL